MANRKLGCLSIFLFVALCASVFMNFVLAVTVFRRLSGAGREEEPTPYFRETIVQRGSKGSNDKIAANKAAFAAAKAAADKDQAAKAAAWAKAKSNAAAAKAAADLNRSWSAVPLPKSR